MSYTSIPSDMARHLSNPEMPWQMSRKLFEELKFKKEDTNAYKICPVTQEHKEWGLVTTYFESDIPQNRMISEIFCLHNPVSTKAFEQKILATQVQAENPRFAPMWREKEPHPLRERTIDIWSHEAGCFGPISIEDQKGRKNPCGDVKVLPLWHGSSNDKCDSIAEGGFVRFGKHVFAQGGTDERSTDIGIFGDGLYFTNSARYATESYSKTDPDDGRQHLLLTWVSMREPFPIISHEKAIPPNEPQDIVHLKGQGAYDNYNAHYMHVVPVRDGTGVLYHYPVAEGEMPRYNEVVVFNETQTLARFWVKLQVALLRNPSLFPKGMSAVPKAALSELPLETLKPEEAKVPSPSVQAELLSPAQEAAVSVEFAIPPQAFGRAKWLQYFGEIGEEPALPSDIQKTLQGPCPFWPGKTVQETHMLILLPKTVNGAPLTLNSLEELVKHPKQGPATKYRYCWSEAKKALGDQPLSQSSWVLMTKDVLKGSKFKNYADQCKLVEGFSQRTGIPYQVPTTLETAICVFLDYVQSGKHLYSRGPWTYTRCQEKLGGYQLAVGGFAASGLVVCGFFDGDIFGVSCLRKFV